MGNFEIIVFLIFIFAVILIKLHHKSEFKYFHLWSDMRDQRHKAELEKYIENEDAMKKRIKALEDEIENLKSVPSTLEKIVQEHKAELYDAGQLTLSKLLQEAKAKNDTSTEIALTKLFVIMNPDDE